MQLLFWINRNIASIVVVVILIIIIIVVIIIIIIWIGVARELFVELQHFGMGFNSSSAEI